MFVDKCFCFFRYLICSGLICSGFEVYGSFREVFRVLVRFVFFGFGVSFILLGLLGLNVYFFGDAGLRV